MVQRAIPAVYMRGGTSRALIFREQDLPRLSDLADRRPWDEIFCGAIGSPDPYRRQLNGMGGGITSLSKIAIVGPPTRPDADVDYTFGQVDVTSASVGYRGNCGNISSAIGPFAVDEGIVTPSGDAANVVIHNTNTGKLIRAGFSMDGDKAAVSGDFVLSGVAGSGAPIELAFLEPGGAVSGKLLPSGRVRDVLSIPGLGQIEVSLVDASNPTVFVRAEALGLTGRETPDQLSADRRAMALFEDVRVAAAVAMGLVQVPEEARTSLRNLPFVALLTEPTPRTAKDAGAHIVTRMVSSGQPHKACMLTGAMCLAIAARINGTIAAEIIGASLPVESDIIVEHPSGRLPVAARVTAAGVNSIAHEAVVYRTARRLMEGRVYIPG